MANNLESHDAELKNLQNQQRQGPQAAASCPRPASPRPERPTPTPPPPSTCAPEEAAIKQVLDNYARAYSTRQVEAVKSVQPLSPQEAKDLAAMFADVTDYRITVDSVTCVFSSDFRTVKVSANRIETKIQNNHFMPSNALMIFSMDKQKGGWKIVKIQRGGGQESEIVCAERTTAEQVSANRIQSHGKKLLNPAQSTPHSSVRVNY